MCGSDPLRQSCIVSTLLWLQPHIKQAFAAAACLVSITRDTITINDGQASDNRLVCRFSRARAPDAEATER